MNFSVYSSFYVCYSFVLFSFFVSFLPITQFNYSFFILASRFLAKDPNINPILNFLSLFLFSPFYFHAIFFQLNVTYLCVACMGACVRMGFFRCIANYTFGVDLGAPFFPGGHELWHHPLAYSAAAAAELPSAALQHATLVHPALHPQVPVRSYL